MPELSQPRAADPEDEIVEPVLPVLPQGELQIAPTE
jgi:hypothetical protein